jgi:hypothetical protein
MLPATLYALGLNILSLHDCEQKNSVLPNKLAKTPVGAVRCVKQT